MLYAYATTGVRVGLGLGGSEGDSFVSIENEGIDVAQALSQSGLDPRLHLNIQPRL